MVRNREIKKGCLELTAIDFSANVRPILSFPSSKG